MKSVRLSLVPISSETLNVRSARFDGVDGRLHVTFGLELRVFQFYAWGLRRGAITLTADTAHSYQNAGLSIGFWH